MCPCSATHIRPAAARSHQCICDVSHLLSVHQQTKRMYVDVIFTNLSPPLLHVESDDRF